MTPTVVEIMFDLRDEDFRTHAEMDEALVDRMDECRVEYGNFETIAIVLHEQQVKWLKLELYETQRNTTDELKKMTLGSWKNIPVYVVDEWERVPCADCGHIHD